VGFAVALFLSVGAVAGWAQEQQIDASKPTNFYFTLVNNVEYLSREGGNDIYGYRAELVYPLSERHLLLGEVPLLYNDGTDKFGLSDVRLRYFWLPYKNYDNFFGAFGPSIDVFAPTGKYEDGLGSSSWSFSLGATGALMFADWIQTFPIVSYLYSGKPTTDAIPEGQKEDRHGVTIQSITPVVFSKKVFTQITPVWSLSDIEEEKTSRYIQEVLVQYALTPTLQVSGFWRGIFKDKSHTFRVGLVIFLM
jgi:hypothetical protein